MREGDTRGSTEIRQAELRPILGLPKSGSLRVNGKTGVTKPPDQCYRLVEA